MNIQYKQRQVWSKTAFVLRYMKCVRVSTEVCLIIWLKI